MRTTVAIDDHLLERAKERARERNLTLGRLIEDALRRELASGESRPTGPTVPVFKGTGARPGVDLSSYRSIAEALDDDALDRIP
ncbi:MAG: antitoxin [Acidimicrobiia bacterium]|nr:antitoxin [Acidimicrobiia bacterium]